MSKKDHDQYIAKLRKNDSSKGRYTKTLDIIKKLNLRSFNIADIGCGNGAFAQLISSNINKAKLICTDYTKEHLKEVKDMGFTTLKCDFDNNIDNEILINRYKNSFDVVVILEVIEHIFDTDKLLSTCNQILKPNGYLIISTPNLDYLPFHLYSLMKGNIPVGEGHHVRFFDIRKLNQFLTLNGFDLISNYNFGQSMYWIDRLLNNKSKLTRFISKYFLYGLMKIIPNNSSKKYSSLHILAQKNNLSPIGFEVFNRKKNYHLLKRAQKIKVIKSLSAKQQKHLFDEHPNLYKFINEENNKYLNFL